MIDLITTLPIMETSASKPVKGKNNLFKVIGNALLYIASFAGILITLFAIASMLQIVTPLIVTSGSMEPVLSAGDVVISHQVAASTINIGDIVSSKQEDGTLVTHRVTKILSDDKGLVSFVMQGDANNAADANPYIASTVRVSIVIIPNVGNVMAVLSNNKIIGSAAFMAIAVVWMIWTPDKKKRKKVSATSHVLQK